MIKIRFHRLINSLIPVLIGRLGSFIGLFIMVVLLLSLWPWSLYFVLGLILMLTPLFVFYNFIAIRVWPFAIVSTFWLMLFWAVFLAWQKPSLVVVSMIVLPFFLFFALLDLLIISNALLYAWALQGDNFILQYFSARRQVSWAKVIRILRRKNYKRSLQTMINNFLEEPYSTKPYQPEWKKAILAYWADVLRENNPSEEEEYYRPLSGFNQLIDFVLYRENLIFWLQAASKEPLHEGLLIQYFKDFNQLAGEYIASPYPIYPTLAVRFEPDSIEEIFATLSPLSQFSSELEEEIAIAQGMLALSSAIYQELKDSHLAPFDESEGY